MKSSFGETQYPIDNLDGMEKNTPRFSKSSLIQKKTKKKKHRIKKSIDKIVENVSSKFPIITKVSEVKGK